MDFAIRQFTCSDGIKNMLSSDSIDRKDNITVATGAGVHARPTAISARSM
ncbi:hypothetical protein [Tatumella ptyseos]|nr:hypothetical protein [Tatumella ptyseos]